MDKYKNLLKVIAIQDLLLANLTAEPTTHILEVVQEEEEQRMEFEAAVEKWSVVEFSKEDCSVDRTEIQFSFKRNYPPGMRLSKNFKAQVKEWQKI